MVGRHCQSKFEWHWVFQWGVCSELIENIWISKWNAQMFVYIFPHCSNGRVVVMKPAPFPPPPIMLRFGVLIDTFVIPFVAETSPLIQTGRGCFYEAVRGLSHLLPTGLLWEAAAINAAFLCQALLKVFFRPSLSKHLYNSAEIRSSWRLLQEVCHWHLLCIGRRKLAAATDMASWNSFPYLDYLKLNLMRQAWAGDKHNQKSSTESQTSKQA